MSTELALAIASAVVFFPSFFVIALCAAASRGDDMADDAFNEYVDRDTTAWTNEDIEIVFLNREVSR